VYGSIREAQAPARYASGDLFPSGSVPVGPPGCREPEERSRSCGQGPEEDQEVERARIMPRLDGTERTAIVHHPV
jgi:hypothetical protein